MRCLLLINFITILSIVCLTHSKVEGFEAKGYKMGMGIEEARKVAGQHGKKLLNNEYFYFEEKSNDMIYFCKNKLTQLSYPVSRGFMSYTKQLRDFIREGFKVIDVIPHTQILYDGKENVTLNIYLRKTGKDWHVEMSLFATEGTGIENYQINYVDSIGPVTCK